MAEAVERELKEETGIESVCGQLVGWVERISDHHHFVIFDFAVDLVLGVDELPLPVAADDAAEARWVPFSDVHELDLVPGMAEFIAEHGVID